jgi:hypothetical protein
MFRVCLATPSSSEGEWKIIIPEESFFFILFQYLIWVFCDSERENIERIKGLRDSSSGRRDLLSFWLEMATDRVGG